MSFFIGHGMFIFLMLAAVLTLAVCSALRSSAREESERAVGRVRVCGRDLVDTLLFVCTTFDMLSNSAGPGSKYLGEEYQEPMDIFRSRRSALSFRLRRSFRRRRGIASECCHKSCTFQELSSYCIT